MTLGVDAATLSTFTNTTMQPFNDIKNPIWRLTSGELYQIRDRSGYSVPFVPTELQAEIIASIHGGLQKVIVTDDSEQQRGISTLAGILMLDTMLFNPGCIVANVGCTSNQAKAINAERFLHTFNHLPTWVKASLVACNKGTGEYAIDVGGEISHAHFGHYPPGTTLGMLWVSQWSEMQKRFPMNAKDVQCGAFPLARKGITFIEAANIAEPFQTSLP